MGGYPLHLIAVVDDRFENLDFLPGNGSPAQAPDHLVGFSAEHGTSDHFDCAGMMLHIDLEGGEDGTILPQNLAGNKKTDACAAVFFLFFLKLNPDGFRRRREGMKRPA